MLFAVARETLVLIFWWYAVIVLILYRAHCVSLRLQSCHREPDMYGDNRFSSGYGSIGIEKDSEDASPRKMFGRSIATQGGFPNWEVVKRTPLGLSLASLALHTKVLGEWMMLRSNTMTRSWKQKVTCDIGDACHDD